jgi:general stress protein 26
MSDERDPDKVRKVWKLIERMRGCMLVTQRAGRMDARPMHAIADVKSNAIYFLADARGVKDDEIARAPQVCLTFADGERFLSISGTASVRSDQEKIRELWSTEAQAWWDGPDDPNIRVLTVSPSEAAFWENPGRLVNSVDLAVAAVAGVRPPINPAYKVDMG